jgi:hypothetical protein
MSEEMPLNSEVRLGAWSLVLGVAIIVILVGLAAYSFHEHSAVTQLAAQNSEASAALAATRGQMDELNAKINSLVEERSAKPSASLPAQHLNPTKHSAHHTRRAADPRWKALQGQVDEQGKQIESTRQDLTNTRTELQGSIARTHDELVVLQKKGERAYFEFDVDKNGQFQHDGPMGVRLRKANVKHQYADLELMVDDFKVSKKHVNIFEPVVFYTAESQRPVELVINGITKDHIRGYVSEPKYKTADLQAASDSGNASQEKPSPQRPRLEVPSN